MTIVTPLPTIDRDRWGKPLVMLPDGTKKVAYQRCTKFIDVIEDHYNLERWSERMVALGLASRPDLLLSVQAHTDDKNRLNEICRDAKEAAKASAAATTGTALHALTELIDRGKELPVGLPPGVVASLDKYREATSDLKSVHIEQFVVQDTLRVGGTPDRIVKHKRETYIADLKTGTISWGTLKIAQQLAVYSRSHLYDVTTGERSIHGASTQKAIVIHLPAVVDPAEARCDLHWIDIEAGWRAVLVAKNVREQRKLKFDDLTTPFVDLVVTLEDSVKTQIAACNDPDAVRALWRETWTPELTKVAAERVAALETPTVV